MRTLFLALVALSILSACEQHPMDQLLEGESGILNITMDVYTIPDEVVQIKGELSRPDAESIYFEFSMGESSATALVTGIQVGKWTVKVDALNSSDDVIYSGSATVEISAGETTSVHLNLSNTGSLEVVVTWGEAAVLTAFYTFNGDSQDHSGNGHHGINHGASLTYDRFGIPDKAYYFDGIDDVISLDPYVLQGKSISISAWVKKIGDGPDMWNSVVAGDCSTPYFGFLGNSPTFGGQCDSPINHQFGEYELSDTLWHHMVGIYNGSHILLYFDNEVLINEYVGEFEFDHSIPVGIGGSYMHWRDLEGFMGMIDDIRIYNGVLTAREVESLYYENAHILPLEGLVAYYPFNGNAFDESGNGNHGIVYGANLAFDRYGEPDRSYSFNGIDNYIEIPHNPSIDIGKDDFTISLWIQYNTTSGEQVLIEKWIQKWDPVGWTLTKLPGDFLRFAYCEVIEFNVDSEPFEIPANVWHHCALTRNHRTISIYWNGELIKSELMMEDFGYDLSSEVPIKIGHRGNPENTPGSIDRSGFFLNGNMDDIRIYNQALSSWDILSTYLLEKARK